MAAPLDRIREVQAILADVQTKARAEREKLRVFAITAARSATSELASAASTSAGNSEKLLVQAGQDARKAYADANKVVSEANAAAQVGDEHARVDAVAALAPLIQAADQVAKDSQQVQDLVEEATKLRAAADSAAIFHSSVDKVSEAEAAATAASKAVRDTIFANRLSVGQCS